MIDLRPEKKKIHLVKGDIMKTLPKFKSENKDIKIRLLHLDVDLYKPTKLILETLWDNVTLGGIIILDEYGFNEWSGESKAVDEFFRSRNIKVKINKFEWTSNPGAYIIKDSY